MADYMAYWKTDQVHAAIEEVAGGRMVDHAASEQFGKVQRGDTVWIVNIEKGTHRFLLVARIEVGDVVGRIPMNAKPEKSSSGKTLVVASTYGNKKTDCVVDGKKVIVGVNAYIPKK